MSSLIPITSVRLIVKNSDGQVLILRRSNSSHANGSWCLPGGKVDYGDTVEETAIKELREETNLECTSTEFLFFQDSLPDEASEMHVINFYFACVTKGDLQLNEESSESAWITQGDISSYEIVFNNAAGLEKYWASFSESQD